MIPVSLSYLILVYLCIMLGPIFAAWIFYEWRRQRRERAAFQYVLRCNLCGFEFEDKTEAVLPRCPRCGSLNERLRLPGL